MTFVGAFDNGTNTMACYFCGDSRGNLDLTRPPAHFKPHAKDEKSLKGMLLAYFPMEEAMQASILVM